MLTPHAVDHRTCDAVENDQAILFVLHLVAFDDEDRRVELRHLNLVRPLEPANFLLSRARRQGDLKATEGRKPPKLIHKLMFSMPPGTPPDKVLAAVRNFASEEFAFRHRYAFVLHTDEAHPHVHLVLKAVSEQGVRLNIKKATLRHWRLEFARNLRGLGVSANATERAVRGEGRVNKIDGVFRAEQRGTSTRIRNRVELTAFELARGNLRPEPGRQVLMQTRKEVERGWRALSEILNSEGQRELAADVSRFVVEMPVPRTEKEQIALALLHRVHQPRQFQLGLDQRHQELAR